MNTLFIVEKPELPSLKESDSIQTWQFLLQIEFEL